VRGITAVIPLSESVGKYEKFEAVVDLDADFTNPYDPNDIRLDARFTSPSGKNVTIPGFYYQDFELDLSGPRDLVTPTGESSWRVRFTPDEAGEWSYHILATTLESGTVRSPAHSFTVTESDKHGFVRLDPRNPRYLAFDDGTPYFAVGENMGWYGNGGMVDYQTWLDALHTAGGNFIRVWMPAWGFGIEWNDTGLGHYDARQDEAYRLDTLMDMADERGIYIMLTLINHGQYSTSTNPEWDANPFNAANGGPLETPGEFATNPEAGRLWNQRLRYIAARWGYSTNIMAWEWWNEINWTPLVNRDLLAPWVSRSAAYLKTVDPYNHLTTHSGSPVGDEVVWEQMDFVQAHRYNMTDLLMDFNLTISDWRAQYPDKPFLMGEFGNSGGPSEYDLEGVLLHLGLWAAPMNGAFGTGMTWWWDSYVHPNHLYDQFAGIAAFFADEDLAAYDYRPTEAQVNREARSRVYGMQTDQRALLWITSRRYTETELLKQYTQNLRDGVANPLDISFPEVTDAILTLNGLADSEYTLEWWNTFTGEIDHTETITVSDGIANVTVPAYSADWAVKVVPVE
jgi:hypothetical protein